MTKLSETDIIRRDKAVEMHVLIQKAIAELRDYLALYEKVLDDEIDIDVAADKADIIRERHELEDGTSPIDHI